MRFFVLVVFLIACGGTARPTPSPTRAEQGARALVARCDRGEAMQCYMASAMFEVGAPGVAKDAGRARGLRDRGHQLTHDACIADNAEACRRIVISAKLAYAKTSNPDEQRQLAKTMVSAGTRGCHAGDYDLCIDVAAILHGDAAGPSNDEQSREMVSFACARGHQPACVEHALVLAREPKDARDYERAGELLDGACAKGEADGCEMLATYRLSGGPTAAAGARAAARRACELHDAGGCAVLGHTLLDGIGGPADPAGARVAFETACRGKDPRGCQMLQQLGN